MGKKGWILLFIGIILFQFGISNMMWAYPGNQQITEPFPMTVFEWHFPFSYKFMAPAMYFQEDGTLYFDSYWMVWSLSIYLGIALICIGTKKFREKPMKTFN